MSSIPAFLYQQCFLTPPVPTTSMAGRTIIVTGANTGLGLDCCKHLARLHVARLILACRTPSKGEKAKQEILQAVGREGVPDIEVWQLDMCSYASVLAFAERCESLQRLDGLIANAGVELHEYSRAEDNETTITINVVSTFLLAISLLPKLRESSEKHNIVPHLTVVVSAIHLFAPTAKLQQPTGKIFSSLNDPKTADMSTQYYTTKLLDVLCVRELAAQMQSSISKKAETKPFVTVNCVNPGWCHTELFRSVKFGFGPSMAFKAIGRTSEEGGRTLAHAISAGQASHGQYLSENEIKSTSGFVRSQEGRVVQQNVWAELMAKLEGIKPGVSANI